MSSYRWQLKVSMLGALVALVCSCSPMPSGETITADPKSRHANMPKVRVDNRPTRDTLDALGHYLELTPAKRDALLEQWATALTSGDSAAGLSYAMALAITETNAAQLLEAEAILESLLAHQILDDDDTTLARLTLGNVRSRLMSFEARRKLIQQRDTLQAELQRAQQQIEQLTRIEKELEPETVPRARQLPEEGFPDGPK